MKIFFTIFFVIFFIGCANEKKQAEDFPKDFGKSSIVYNVGEPTEVDKINIIGIDVSVRDTKDPIRVGESTTYVVTVSNEGPDNAEFVSLFFEISPELEFLRAEPEGYVLNSSGMIVFRAQIFSLKFGEKKVYKIFCRAVEEGFTKGRATVMWGDNIEKNRVYEDEGTTIY